MQKNKKEIFPHVNSKNIVSRVAFQIIHLPYSTGPYIEGEQLQSINKIVYCKIMLISRKYHRHLHDNFPRWI